MNLSVIFILFAAFCFKHGMAAPEDIHIHLHGLSKQLASGAEIQGSKTQKEGIDYGSYFRMEECLKTKSRKKCREIEMKEMDKAAFWEAMAYDEFDMQLLFKSFL
eukprot:TRINITY_DN13682_c0_g1_i1.p1 TRINITY_DN13682_c0_g1~~TRINITY_DN13682_c0_g1_i1.p1  ORF type:complete len:123 (-),score=39.05 TRINITY_DN13682_c0_g1_i1:126-440(-)